jgi:serine/threonine-protein kinase
LTLARVAVSGGKLQTLAVPDSARGELGFVSPHALPDGRGVVFTIIPRTAKGADALRIAVIGPGGPHTDLMPGRVAYYAEPGYLLVVGADGRVTATRFDLASRRLVGEPIPVFTVPPQAERYAWTGYVSVARTGALVYVGADVGSNREFAWVGRDGQIAPADFGTGTQPFMFSLSADGQVVVFAYSEPGGARGLEIRQRTTGAIIRVSPSDALLADPFVSLDGRTLVYRSLGDARAGIYRADIDRPDVATRLLADPNVERPSLSVDGRTLSYRRAHNGGFDLVVRALDTPGSAEQVVVSGSSTDRASPDGKWVAFIDTTGARQQLFIRSTDVGRPERWLVSSRARGPVRWAPGGHELFFFGSDSLMAAPVTAGATVVVGPARRLFTMRGTVIDYAPVSDGRFLFLRTSGSHQTHLMMLSDWRRLLPGH